MSSLLSSSSSSLQQTAIASEALEKLKAFEESEAARSFGYWKAKVAQKMMRGENWMETAEHAVEIVSKFYHNKLKAADSTSFFAEVIALVTCGIKPDKEIFNAYEENHKKMTKFEQDLTKCMKELKIHESRKDSGVVELEEKLELAEKAKQKKDREMEGINRKLRNCQNEVSQLTNLVKGLRSEKSKAEAGLTGFDKMKKELMKVKEELKRVEGIANSDKSTIQKLIDENKQLQKSLASKNDEVSRIQLEWRKADLLMKTAKEKTEEEPSAVLEKQKLALKRYELQKLQKTLTDFNVRAEKESVLDAFESSRGTSKNAAKKARMQLEEHFKASEQAAKVVKENLKLIENHLNFTVDSLAIVPFVPPPFTDEMIRMNDFQSPIDDSNNFEEGYEESCGLCSKALNGSKSGLVACNTCNHYWHYQCVVHWYDGNDTSYHQH